MRSYAFTDSAGLAWDVIDYQVVDFRKKRVPVGDWRAVGRAFVPVGREGPPMIHEFGYTPYRDLADRTLNAQLGLAKRAGATAAERMDRSV